MSLDRLIDEIRLRAERELDEQRKLGDEQEQAIQVDRDKRVAQIREDGKRSADLEAARERAQRLASAKLQARKMVYESQERRAGTTLAAAREALADYTSDSAYPNALKRMFNFATDHLGKQIRVTGRAEDAALLKTVAGKNFDPDHPAGILGGLIAETTDGARRLNLSFDELLRLREDEIRSLLA